MMIIGVDYHPSFQAIAFLMEETGECGERELKHSDGQAEKFYRDLKQRGICVRVGMEATGYSRWFERLLAELGFELWIGDPAEIKAKRVKKLKTDRKDAQLLLRLMLEKNFPQIWVPSPENRDLRQLLWHRHRLVQMRTRIMNQLQALAMNEGYRWKKKLFSEQGRAQLEKLSLAPWASRRRQELLELLDRMNPTIEELTVAVEREARKRPEVLRLMMTSPLAITKDQVSKVPENQPQEALHAEQLAVGAVTLQRNAPIPLSLAVSAAIPGIKFRGSVTRNESMQVAGISLNLRRADNLIAVSMVVNAIMIGLAVSVLAMVLQVMTAKGEFDLVPLSMSMTLIFG